MRLETERLTLRDYRESDAEDALEFLGDPEVMAFVEPPFSLQHAREVLLQWGIRDRLVYALEEKATGRLAGQVIFHPFGGDGTYELGWILSRGCWRKGYAREIGEALIRYAFDVLGARRVAAEAAVRNTASLAVIRRLGMQEISGGELRLYALERPVKS